MSGGGGGGALSQIFAFLGVKTDHKELDSLNEKVEHATHKLSQLAELAGGAFMIEKIKSFVEGQIEAGAQLKIMSERLGVGTTELQQFQLAAQESGASAEDANTGLRFLNRSIGQATTGSAEAATEFQKLGIHLKDAHGNTLPVIEVASQLADKMKGMHSQGERTAAAMKLLGRGGASLLPMFQEGSEGIKEAIKDFEELGGGMSEDFVEAAHKTERETVKMRFQLTSLSSRLTSMLLPIVNQIIRKFMQWTKVGMDLIRRTNVVQTALIALGVALGVLAINLALANLPLLLMVAALGILYLAFDDIYTMITGGDSVLGRLIDRMFGVGAQAKVVDGLKEAWQFLKGAWDEALPVIKELWETFKDGAAGALPEVGAAIMQLFHLFKGLFELMPAVGKLFKTLFTNPTSGKAWDETFKSIDKAGGMAVKDFEKAFDFESPIAHKPSAAATPTGFGSGDGGFGPPAPAKVEININGVSDPHKAADLAGKSVRGAMKGHANEMRDAYAAIGAGG